MREYKRKCSKVILTEDGIYHEGEEPDNYDGAKLTLEVVHAVLFVDDSGFLMTLSCNPPKAKNRTGAEVPYDKDKVYTVTADVNDTFEEGSHYFPEKMKKEADARIETYEKTEGVKVI
jgi:hypothetical protein